MSEKTTDADKVIAVFNEAGEKVGTMADTVSNTADGAAKGMMDTFQNGAGVFFEKISNMTEQYGPELMNVVFDLIQLVGVMHFVEAVVVIGLVYGFFMGVSKGFRSISDNSDEGSEQREVTGGFSHAAKWLGWGVTALVAGSYLTNLFMWLALISPKAALAYKVIGKVIGF